MRTSIRERRITPPTKPAHALGFAYPPNTAYQLGILHVRPTESHTRWCAVDAALGIRYVVLAADTHHTTSLADAIHYHARLGLACPIVKIVRSWDAPRRPSIEWLGFVRPDSQIDWSGYGFD
jgi:hypothetical protein